MSVKKRELRIKGVAEDLVEDLANIAKNEGITLTAFMKPKLRVIVDSYPEHMRRKPMS